MSDAVTNVKICLVHLPVHSRTYVNINTSVFKDKYIGSYCSIQCSYSIAHEKPAYFWHDFYSE